MNWAVEVNYGNDVGEHEEIVYVGAQHGSEAPMADTTGEQIVIDGAITKEDLDRFMASHSRSHRHNHRETEGLPGEGEGESRWMNADDTMTEWMT